MTLASGRDSIFNFNPARCPGQLALVSHSPQALAPLNRRAARQLGHGSRRVTCCHLPSYSFSSLLPCSPSSREYTQDLSYALPELARSLRPLWITPKSSRFPHVAVEPEASSFMPVMRVSISRVSVQGRAPYGRILVQGSGDNYELWG